MQSEDTESKTAESDVLATENAATQEVSGTHTTPNDNNGSKNNKNNKIIDSLPHDRQRMRSKLRGKSNTRVQR